MPLLAKILFVNIAYTFCGVCTPWEGVVATSVLFVTVGDDRGEFKGVRVIEADICISPVILWEIGSVNFVSESFDVIFECRGVDRKYKSLVDVGNYIFMNGLSLLLVVIYHYCEVPETHIFPTFF